MNKKKVFFTTTAIGVLVAAAVFGRGDQLFSSEDSQSELVASTNAAIPAGTPAAVTLPITPERAKIVQSVAEVSGQIVDYAYNDKTEALVSAAAAVSLRVNKTIAESMEQSEKAAVSAYNTALHKAKLDHVDEEAKAALPKEKSEQVQPQTQPYSMPFQRQIEAPAEPKEKTVTPLDTAQLKAILGNNAIEGYRAILIVAGTETSARQGQTLPGGVRVVSIESNRIVLTDGEKNRPLYLP